MSKVGYNCAVWTAKHNEFLSDNFAFMNNDELAAALNKKFTTKKFKLNRTADAVRKQLNKLELSRPKKSDIKTLEKKIGRDNFFKSIKKGIEIKEKRQIEQNKINQHNSTIEKEREWAKRVYGVGNNDQVEKKKVVVRPKPKEDLVWLHLDEKTSIQVKKGEEEIYKAKYLKYKLDKQL